MKCLVTGIILSIVLIGAPVANAQWEQTSGPSFTYSEDTTYAFGFATIGSTIFAGAENGLFESSDTGQSWNNILRRIDTVSTYCIALTTNGNDLFAAPSAGGIFHSTNVGQSWIRVDSGFPWYGKEAGHLWFLSSSNGVLFAGNYGGYDYRSTNNGASWDSLPEIPPNDGYYIVSSNSRLFAWTDNSTYSNTYQSTDTGATWTLLSISGTEVTSVAACGNFVLATIATTGDQGYYSTDNGADWSAAKGFRPKLHGLVINGSFAIANGNWISTNGGSIWTSDSSGISSDEPAGLLLFGNKIFLCNGGIYYSTDSGSSWIDAAAVQVTQSIDVHSLSVEGAKILAGTGDSGIYVTSNDGNTWDQRGLTNRTVYSLLSTSNYLFAGTDAGDTAGGIFRSSDTGATWTRMVNGISNVNALANSGNNLFAGTDSSIYLTSNAGTNWSPVFSHVHVNALAAQGSKVFAGTSANGLITSTNNGTSWSANNGTLPITDVQSLAVKGGILFAGTNGNGLFLSTDTGQSWTDVSSGLPASSVLSLEENSQQFFAGTGGNGIFRTDDSGKTWKQVDSGLVNLNVTSLGIRNGNLFAGTIGGGVWERPLSQMLLIEPASVTQSPSTPSDIHIFPNPFSQSTQITFTSQAAGYADVSIVNALGAEVAHLCSGDLAAGEHSFTWSDPNICNGMYECLVRMNGRVASLPVVLAR